jgi:osmotically-inducible protein OsmY
MKRLLFFGAIGAALAYFFDPDQGARRRNITRDRVGSLLRQSSERGEQLGRLAKGHAEGVAYRATHPAPENVEPDDVTLVNRIESEVFRSRDLEKGQVNINAVAGVVFLRGQLDREDKIKRLEAAVRRVPGVKDVRNLLHVPGKPAPTA